MSRWSYIVFAIVVLGVVTLLNLEHVNDSGGSRSWSRGHSSGSGWSSGGGHK